MFSAGHVILHHYVLRSTQYAQQDGGGETGAILAGAAVPGDGGAIGLQHRMDKLAKLRGKIGGELPVGIHHGQIGVEALEVAGVNAFHDFAYQGLVAIIQCGNLHYGEPCGVR